MRYYPRQDQSGCYVCCIPVLVLLLAPVVLLVLLAATWACGR